jgi:hypothetical protein
MLSVIIFGLVVIPYRLLTRLGVRRHASWPLFLVRKISVSRAV